MRKILIAAATIGMVALSGHVSSAALGVLIPLQQGDHLETKPDPSGAASIPILLPAPRDALHRALIRESRRGAIAFVLKLDEEAQRLSGQAVQPTWLMLTDEEGGFAKRGFWLRVHHRDRFIDQPYVALVVDPGSVSDGSFEEIFAHETGHVLLRRLFPRLPQGMSRLAHGSMTVTDDPTAFDEGFAIHFQALVRRLTANATLRAQDAGISEKPLTSLWQSNVDGALRIDGVRRNWFIHKQMLPPGDDDAWLRRANSSAFDVATLKNGNQMLASEGLVATVFYRALAADCSMARYGSLFRALQDLNSRDLVPDSPLLPMLVQSWRKTDGFRGAAFTKIFIETTYGATVDRALPQAVAMLAQVGRAGDREAFVGQLTQARLQLAAVEQRVNHQSDALTAALGPALWLAATPLHIVNLNTAEADQLAALDHALTDWATQIVAERESQGPYADVTDLARRVDLPAALSAALQEMAVTAIEMGTYPRL